jgi:hypothetical protein
MKIRILRIKKSREPFRICLLNSTANPAKQFVVKLVIGKEKSKKTLLVNWQQLDKTSIRSPFYFNVIGMVHFAMESEDNVTANTSILEQPITVNSCSSKFSSISFENLENVSKMLT